jgi:hypothetical protein
MKMSATMYRDDLRHFEEFRCLVAPCGSKNGSPPFEQFSEIFGRCRGTRFVDAQATEFAPASIQGWTFPSLNAIWTNVGIVSKTSLTSSRTKGLLLRVLWQ